MSPGLAALALPSFRSLEVTEIPQGFAITPRRPPIDFWIEAVVWLAGFVLFALFLLLGGPVLRLLGALGAVGVGMRAVITISKALLGRSIRKLRVLLSGPRATLAGPFDGVPLAGATLSVTRRGNQTYLHAVTPTGKEHWVVDLDPLHAGDYEALVAWLEAFARASSAARA